MRDIERLAREAGFRAGRINSSSGESLLYIAPSHATDCADQLQRFAALVRNEVLEEAAEKGRQTIRLRAMRSRSKIGDDQAVYDAIRALKDKK